MNLYPYQEEGARWLAARNRALLGDSMRVGKTPQAIHACDLIGARGILVVCPGLARQMWARAWDEWSLEGRPLACVMDKDDAIEPAGVTILSMDGSRNDSLHARVMAHSWDVIIIDEQQFLKEPKTLRTQLVLSAKGFASKAKRVWFLTGSPMLNHPGEMWVILRTIGIWTKTYADFEDRYCVGYMGEYEFKVTGTKNALELKTMLDRVMLRRTFYGLNPDAPRPTWLSVALDPTLTDPADIAALADVENHPRYGRAVVKALTRVAAGEAIDWAEAIPQSNFAMLRRLTSAAKAKPAAHWLAERLQSGEIDKIVVFAHHSGIVDTLTRDLAPFGAAGIHGRINDATRQRNIDEFTAMPNRRVIVAQDQIARTAIDLTAANKLFFAETDPVPANNAQAAFRVQGPKQRRPVTIYAAHLPNSTDEQITKINARKTAMECELFS